jgi:hypothetical protein
LYPQALILDPNVQLLNQCVLCQPLLHVDVGAGSALAQALTQALTLQALTTSILAPASVASTIVTMIATFGKT